VVCVPRRNRSCLAYKRRGAFTKKPRNTCGKARGCSRTNVAEQQARVKMKESLFVLLVMLLAPWCWAGGSSKQCIQFEVVNASNLDTSQYTVVGPNLILNQHNELVLTDPNVVQGPNFTTIQGVTYSYYGEPICIAIIDCGAAGTGSVNVSILNVQSLRTFSDIVLKEVCSNYGVFFGCVDTAYVPLNETEPVPPGFVGGEFGDELVIQYTSSEPIDGSRKAYSQAIWLSCKELEYWDYELISTLMVEDSLSRNIRQLTALREQIVQLQNTLFGGSTTCEDFGANGNLAAVATESFEFLDCIVDRYTDAVHFYSEVAQYAPTNISSSP